MKKGLVVLLILALAGAAFAQEITFSGQVEAGLLFQKEGDGDLTVTPHNDDADKPIRADLNAAATFGNYGAKIRIRTDNGTSFFPGYAFAWGDLFDGLLKVSGGKLSDAAWATDGDFDTQYDNVGGVRVEFKPFEGFNIGFALDGGSAAGGTAAQFFKETVIGAKYTSDFITIGGAIKLDSDGDVSDPPVPDTDEGTKFLYTLKVAPGPLTVVVDGEFAELGSKDIQFTAHQNIGFQISDPFEVHLALKEAGGLEETKDSKIGITPGLSFGITEAVTLKGDLGFTLSTVEDSPIEITIKPGVAYAFGSKAEINAWYKAYINPENVKDADPNHEVQIDFIWKF